MVRPREFEETEVKEAIMNVFWEKGYESTSIQDLVEATGLLRGSLYGAFGDKRDLYLTALAHYDRIHIQAGVELLRMEGTLSEKVSRLFDSVLDSIKTSVFAGGCLLCNASVEMAAVDKDVQTAVQHQIQRLQSSVTNVLESKLTDKDEIDTLSGFILSAYFGTRVLAKAGMPIAMIRKTRDRCLQCLPR